MGAKHYAPALAHALSPADSALLALVNPLQTTGRIAQLEVRPSPLAIQQGLTDLRLWPRVSFLEERFGPSGLLPAELNDAARQERFRAAAWNVMLMREQGELLSHLADRGVRCFGLKGSSLAQMLHADVAARDVNDIDLAVPANQLAAAGEAMEALGFRGVRPLPLLRCEAFLDGATFKTAQANFVRRTESGRLLVELHWRLYPGEPSKGWPVRTYADAGETLAPSALFFYLCVQFAARGWTDLHKLCDIGDVLLRFGVELDATEFFELAARSGHRRNVSITLELLAALFGFTWSAHAPDWRIREATQELLRRPFLRSPAGSLLDYHRERVRFADRRRDRLNYLQWILRPAPEDFVLPDGGLRNAPAAYLSRWGRLAGLVASKRGVGPGAHARGAE